MSDNEEQLLVKQLIDSKNRLYLTYMESSHIL